MHRNLRADAISCFQQGVAAADPYLAVKRHLLTAEGTFGLRLADGRYRSDSWSKIHVVAFGKAACAMVKAAKDCVPPHLLAARCLAVTNDENVIELEGIDVLTASHPLPDARGLQAAHLLAERVAKAQAHELVLVLISGGGSALLPLPVPDISLADKALTTDLLLASGATINQINCVRKHLSQFKGGGLAKLAQPAAVHALILSDVLGDDLSSIASGPTVPDDTTYTDAIEILHTKQLWHTIPDRVKQHLVMGQQGNVAETPKSGDYVFLNTSNVLIGSNSVSVNAVMQTAENLGYQTLLYSNHLCGEAREQAEKLVLFTKEYLLHNRQKTLAILAGGETTVTLKGQGLGGRNQEMALAFALYAEQHTLSADWVFLSGGTDGRDGPTDAAGGVVDSGTLMRLRTIGINPIAMLDDNDSYTALDLANDLLKTGATGTNVADIQILLTTP